MLKGKTKSGFEYEIPDEALNNFELLEALSEVEGNPMKLPLVVTLLLGSEQKKRLFDHLRTETGVVPTDIVSNEILEIFTGGNQGKNS